MSARARESRPGGQDIHDATPKITVAGRAGACLLTFAIGRLDPQLLPPALLYGLSALGGMLILWEAVTYAAQLTQHIRSRSKQGPWPRPAHPMHPLPPARNGFRMHA